MSAWGDVQSSPLPPPAAWYLHQAGTDEFTAGGEHCQKPRCRGPVEVVTHRRYRRAGKVLRAEHFWCRQHGREWAARHGVEVEAESERSARYLTGREADEAAAAGQRCHQAGCTRPPACRFREAYLWRGKPGANEDEFCREHGWRQAARWRIIIAPASTAGGSR